MIEVYNLKFEIPDFIFVPNEMIYKIFLKAGCTEKKQLKLSIYEVLTYNYFKYTVNFITSNPEIAAKHLLSNDVIGNQKLCEIIAGQLKALSVRNVYCFKKVRFMSGKKLFIFEAEDWFIEKASKKLKIEINIEKNGLWTKEVLIMGKGPDHG